MERCTSFIQTPIGTVRVIGDAAGVRRIEFCDGPGSDDAMPTDAVRLCVEQLLEYFDGKRTVFDSIPLAYGASDFRLSVWEAAMRIPYGTVATYGDIAEQIGNPSASRAVGGALNANPLLLIIPCHRIVPSAARTLDRGGFAAGTWRKEWLIDHEERRTQQSN